MRSAESATSAVGIQRCVRTINCVSLKFHGCGGIRTKDFITKKSAQSANVKADAVHLHSICELANTHITYTHIHLYTYTHTTGTLCVVLLRVEHQVDLLGRHYELNNTVDASRMLRLFFSRVFDPLIEFFVF